MAKYRKPVDVLLTLGDLQESHHQWPDYSEYGIGAEHFFDLIQLATDSELHWADSESLEVWAPIHAWRALGQLRAVEAIDPLLNLFHELEEDGWGDWTGEELPRVFGLIGAAAIPALAAYLADTSHNISPRISAAHALAEIGMSHAEAEEACIAALTQQLEAFRKNDRELNGFLISFLVDLQAIETAPLMQRAYSAGRVDEIVMGDWEDVQVALGLKPYVERDADFFMDDIEDMDPEDRPFAFKPQSAAKRKKAKTKRNMARKSRKQNRKKNQKKKRRKKKKK